MEEGATSPEGQWQHQGHQDRPPHRTPDLRVIPGGLSHDPAQDVFAFDAEELAEMDEMARERNTLGVKSDLKRYEGDDPARDPAQARAAALEDHRKHGPALAAFLDQLDAVSPIQAHLMFAEAREKNTMTYRELALDPRLFAKVEKGFWEDLNRRREERGEPKVNLDELLPKE